MIGAVASINVSDVSEVQHLFTVSQVLTSDPESVPTAAMVTNGGLSSPPFPKLFCPVLGSTPGNSEHWNSDDGFTKWSSVVIATGNPRSCIFLYQLAWSALILSVSTRSMGNTLQKYNNVVF